MLHVNYVQSTCTECVSCYVILCLLCYAMVGCCAVPGPSLTLGHSVHLTIKDL